MNVCDLRVVLCCWRACGVGYLPAVYRVVTRMLYSISSSLEGYAYTLPTRLQQACGHTVTTRPREERATREPASRPIFTLDFRSVPGARREHSGGRSSWRTSCRRASCPHAPRSSCRAGRRRCWTERRPGCGSWPAGSSGSA